MSSRTTLGEFAASRNWDNLIPTMGCSLMCNVAVIVKREEREERIKWGIHDWFVFCCCCCCFVFIYTQYCNQYQGVGGWEKIWWNCVVASIKYLTRAVCVDGTVNRSYQCKKRISNADCWYEIGYHMSDFTGARCMNSSLFPLPLIGYALQQQQIYDLYHHSQKKLI